MRETPEEGRPKLVVENYINKTVEDYRKESSKAYALKIKDGPWLTFSFEESSPSWITAVENEVALNDALIKNVTTSPLGRFLDKGGLVDSYAMEIRTNKGHFRVKYSHVKQKDGPEPVMNWTIH